MQNKPIRVKKADSSNESDSSSSDESNDDSNTEKAKLLYTEKLLPGAPSKLVVTKRNHVDHLNEVIRLLKMVLRLQIEDKGQLVINPTFLQLADVIVSDFKLYQSSRVGQPRVFAATLISVIKRIRKTKNQPKFKIIQYNQIKQYHTISNNNILIGEGRFVRHSMSTIGNSFFPLGFFKCKYVSIMESEDNGCSWYFLPIPYWVGQKEFQYDSIIFGVDYPNDKHTH